MARQGDDTTSPSVELASRQSRGYQFGLKFAPTVQANLSGIHYFDDGSATGYHAAALWTPEGKALASATLDSSHTRGWHTAKLSSPVTLKPGTSYVISYASPAWPVTDPKQVNPFPAGALDNVRLQATLISRGAGFPHRQYKVYGLPVLPALGTVVAPVPAPSPTPTATNTTAPTPAPAPKPTEVADPPSSATSPPAPGSVGYRGSTSSLKVVSSSSSAPSGTRWDPAGYLTTDSNNLVLDGYYIKGGLEYTGSGTLTVRNSVIEGGAAWFIFKTGENCAVDIRDSTLRWKPGATAPQGWGAGAIHGDCRLTAIRNDISGTPDGIQNGPGNSLIQQNWIHDLALLGTYPNETHNDGIQWYSGPNIRVLYNRIDIGFDGLHQNAALFFQPGGGSSIDAPQIIGNYLGGGGFILRLEGRTTGAVVQDNVFAPLGKGWGEAYIRGGAQVSSWSNNRSSVGAQVAKPAAEK